MTPSTNSKMQYITEPYRKYGLHMVMVLSVAYRIQNSKIKSNKAKGTENTHKSEKKTKAQFNSKYTR